MEGKANIAAGLDSKVRGPNSVVLTQIKLMGTSRGVLPERGIDVNCSPWPSVDNVELWCSDFIFKAFCKY